MNLNVDEPTGLGPLREFIGTGAPIKEVTRTYDGRDTVSGEFNFTDIEILEQVDVYPFPTFSFSINFSNPQKTRSKNTRWEHMAQSVRNLGLRGRDAFGQIADKRQHWKMVPALVRMRDEEDNQFKDMEDLVWTLLEVEGIETPEDLTQGISSNGNGASSTKGAAAAESKRHTIARIADGKTQAEFGTAATADAQVRKWSAEMDEITEQTMLTSLVNEGLLTRDDDGVFHVTDAVVAVG